jgi:hypothetical protein
VSAGGRARRWLTRCVGAAALVAIAAGAVDSLIASRRVFRYARRHATEPLATAQDRLFGADYMASIRAVRGAIGLNQTVYFVDDARDPASTYFALFHLAPRRLVWVGRVGERLAPETKGSARRARQIVRVPADIRPLELVGLRRPPPPTKHRARQARP